MTDSNPDPEHETLAARSKRLEAEASEMIKQAEQQAKAQMQKEAQQQENVGDPLAPKPVIDDALAEDIIEENKGDVSNKESSNEESLYPENDPIDFPQGATTDLALQKELEDVKEKMLRAAAETENIRRRAAKEREDARKYSIAGFSKDLLNVADNLRRALEAIPAELLEREEQVKNLVDGIEATERELLRAFEKNGIKKVTPTIGSETFDPNQHEVMFEAPGTGQPGGMIIQVLEAGYTLHDRLIRPARVGVAKDEGNGDTGNGSINTEA